MWPALENQGQHYSAFVRGKPCFPQKQKKTHISINLSNLKEIWKWKGGGNYKASALSWKQQQLQKANNNKKERVKSFSCSLAQP